MLPHLEDQCSEFLKSWMAYLDFKEFPDLIKYYTTIGNGTILKEKYTTIKECTLVIFTLKLQLFLVIAQITA